MTCKYPVAAAALVLLGCGRQPAATSAAAAGPAPAAAVAAARPAAQPAGSPVVSAEPAVDSPEAPDPEPRESIAAAPAQRTFVIPARSRIRVRLAQTLDTKFTRPGTRFAATLDEPIVVGDRVAVPKGTPFTGVVVASKRSGRFRGRGLMELTLRSFRMNGVTYGVATAPDTRVSGSHKKRNLALLGGGPAAGAGAGALAAGGTGALIGAGVGAAAGTTAAFITGRKNVRLPVETPLVFSLRSSVAVRRS